MGFSCRYCGEEEILSHCENCKNEIHFFCDGSTKIISHLTNDNTPLEDIPDSRCKLKIKKSGDRLKDKIAEMRNKRRRGR